MGPKAPNQLPSSAIVSAITIRPRPSQIPSRIPNYEEPHTNKKPITPERTHDLKRKPVRLPEPKQLGDILTYMHTTNQLDLLIQSNQEQKNKRSKRSRKRKEEKKTKSTMPQSLGRLIHVPPPPLLLARQPQRLSVRQRALLVERRPELAAVLFGGLVSCLYGYESLVS